jgi:hypothetical protein
VETLEQWRVVRNRAVHVCVMHLRTYANRYLVLFLYVPVSPIRAGWHVGLCGGKAEHGVTHGWALHTANVVLLLAVFAVPFVGTGACAGPVLGSLRCYYSCWCAVCTLVPVFECTAGWCPII